MTDAKTMDQQTVVNLSLSLEAMSLNMKKVPPPIRQYDKSGITFKPGPVSRICVSRLEDPRIEYAIKYIEGVKPNKKTDEPGLPPNKWEPVVSKIIENCDQEYKQWLTAVHLGKDKKEYEDELKKWNEDPAPIQRKTVNGKKGSNEKHEVEFKNMSKKTRDGKMTVREVRKPTFRDNPLDSDDPHTYALRLLARRSLGFNKPVRVKATIFIDIMIRQIVRACYLVAAARNDNRVTVDHFNELRRNPEVIKYAPLINIIQNYRSVNTVNATPSHTEFKTTVKNICKQVHKENFESRNFTVAKEFTDLICAIADEFATRMGSAFRRTLVDSNPHGALSDINYEIASRVITVPIFNNFLITLLTYNEINVDEVFTALEDYYGKYKSFLEEKKARKKTTA
jgi:hypothetical protein